MVTFLQDYRPIFMVVTFAFLGSAFYLTYRPRPGATAGPNNDDKGPTAMAASPVSRIMKWNRIMLWAVTVVAVVFLFFPQTVTSLFASGDAVTADMEQTVISIEGMT
jgi:hypothetical protein